MPAMPEHDFDTYEYAYAHARARRRFTALYLASDILCLAGGVSLALGVWLLTSSALGIFALVAGVSLGAGGLALAIIIGVRAARAAHDSLLASSAARQPLQQALGPETSMD